MVDSCSVRMRGPLVPYRDGVWARLMAQGYAPSSTRNLLMVVSHLSRWLSDQRLAPAELGSPQIAAFLQARRRAGYTTWVTARGLEPFLAHLREVGVVPSLAVAAAEPSVRSSVLGEYEHHLVHERALAPETVGGYLRTARQFLAERGDAQDPRLDDLEARDITSFVLREAGRWSVGYAKIKVNSLRSLLRFLHVRGLITRDLAAAVPGVAGWRLAGLPKALTPGELRKLLRSCDRRTATGLRDHAALLVLVRLGLRASDVANLRLEDIRWREGYVLVRGKGRHEDRLPLPREVGQALSSYLRKGRPRSASRCVFLCAIAPFGPVDRCVVSGLVRRAAKRVGLGAVGSHRLRHTAATQMLRHGASLTDVAQVLRHRSVATTAIYAKVDDDRLRMLARAWPGRSR